MLKLLSGVLALLLTLIILPPLLGMLAENGAARPNYRGEMIPVGAGLVLISAYLLTALLLYKWFASLRAVCFVLGIAAFSLLGLLDDLLGDRSSRGLKGHFSALSRGRLTTGALKALGGGVVALLLACWTMAGRPWWEQLTAALLIALAANGINLLDLRPGRAVKVFLLWALAVVIARRGGGSVYILAPLMGSVLAYAPTDLRARGMLGDSGSNPLGAALGLVTVWNSPFTVQLLLVILLLLLHLFTEKYSLTAVIAGNRLLSFIDQLGRGRVEEEKQ